MGGILTAGRGIGPGRGRSEMPGCALEYGGGLLVAGSEGTGDDVEDRTQERLSTTPVEVADRAGRESQRLGPVA
jgi:hypothetical protein